MTPKQAKQIGAEAFSRGLGRAPALNREFTRAICRPENVHQSSLLMQSYMHGWTVALLANDATMPDLPSVTELAEIQK